MARGSGLSLRPLYETVLPFAVQLRLPSALVLKPCLSSEGLMSLRLLRSGRVAAFPSLLRVSRTVVSRTFPLLSAET